MSVFALLAYVVAPAVILSLALTTHRVGIGPISTSRAACNAIVESIPSDRPLVVYELGSGFGRLAFELARSRPNATVIAYELSPIPWLVTTILSAAMRLPNLKILRQDFRSADLSDADYLTCYLFPAAMTAISERTDLRVGTSVISNRFPIKAWTPKSVLELTGATSTEIYWYETAASSAPLRRPRAYRAF